MLAHSLQTMLPDMNVKWLKIDNAGSSTYKLEKCI
jgi:hypothetical protein